MHAHGHTAGAQPQEHAWRPPIAARSLFFEDVAHALYGTHEILIMGPAHTKQEFASFLREKHAPLAQGIVAVENADHPTDAEVLRFARRHFKAMDRMFTPA